MKKQLLILSFFSIFFSTSLISQSNKINLAKSNKKNGEVVNLYFFIKIEARKGYNNESLFSFRLKKLSNSNLINWRKSIMQISPERAIYFIDSINSIYRDEICPPLFILEYVTLKNGEKNGEFNLMLTELEVKNQEILTKNEKVKIESGTYLNGKYNGNINTADIMGFSNQNTNSFFDKRYLEGFNDKAIQIIYSDGTIVDQKISLSGRSFKNVLSVGTNLQNYDFYLKPFIEIKDGQIVRILTTHACGKHYSNDINLPELQIMEDNNLKVYRFTTRPYCWNNNSFFTKDDYKLNEDFEKPLVQFENGLWNKISLFLECFQYDKTTGKINGDYFLYSPTVIDYYTFNEFDERFNNEQLNDNKKYLKMAKYTYSNGLKNGENYFYYFNGLPNWKISYENDLLHGKSEMYYQDGNLGCTINYENGLPIGEAVSYYNSSEQSIPYLKTEIRSDHIKAGIYLPMTTLKYNKQKDIQNAVDIAKSNNGKITNFKNNQTFNKVTYLIDSTSTKNSNYEKFSYIKEDTFIIYNNNKPMLKYPVNHNSKYKAEKSSNFVLLDETGKIVYTKDMQDQKNNEANEKERQEKLKKQEELNNSIVRCKWCNKEVVYKNGVITDENIDCNKSVYGIGGVIGCTRYMVCSNACKVSYEENHCRKNSKN
jgi:antitoxin component YwqK of YwqJK toxin-antitoxin module